MSHISKKERASVNAMRRETRMLIYAGITAAALWLGWTLEGNAQNSPYSNVPLGSITLTSATTSLALPFGTRNNSYSTCAAEVTGVALSTATIGVLGTTITTPVSTDYFALGSLATAAAPATTATTQTVTTATLLYFNCAGLSSVKFITSGTFTATSITIRLTGSVNGQISRGGGGGGSGAPVPCGAGSTNYACLSLANTFAATQAISGGGFSVTNNATTGIGSEMVRIIDNEGATTNSFPMSVLMPNMTGGSAAILSLGQSETSGNAAGIAFHFVSAGSTSNYTTYGMYSGVHNISTFVSGHSCAGCDATDPGVEFGVTGAEAVTGTMQWGGGAVWPSSTIPYSQNNGFSNSSAIVGAQNTTSCVGVGFPEPVTTGHIFVNAVPGDVANFSDVGFYNSAGTSLVHVGATHFATNGNTLAWVGGTQTIPAGKNYYCVTSNDIAPTLGIAAFQSGQTFFNYAQLSGTGTTTGGVLNANITPPADAPGVGAGVLIPAFILEN